MHLSLVLTEAPSRCLTRLQIRNLRLKASLLMLLCHYTFTEVPYYCFPACLGDPVQSWHRFFKVFIYTELKAAIPSDFQSTGPIRHLHCTSKWDLSLQTVYPAQQYIQNYCFQPPTHLKTASNKMTQYSLLPPTSYI